MILWVASYMNICVYLCSSVVSFFLTTDGHRWTRMFLTTNEHEFTRMYGLNGTAE